MSMRSLFDIGLMYEKEDIGCMNKANKAVQQLIDDIYPNEEIFFAQHYAAEIRQTAEYYIRSGRISNPDDHPLISGLLETADTLEERPHRGRLIIPPDCRARLQQRRRELIQFAIANVIPLPESILGEYSKEVLNTMAGGSLRSYKAIMTATAKWGGETNDDLFSAYGIRIRRQDGKKVGHTEISQIQAAFDEIFAIFGNLDDLIRAVGLTIIHTGGKHVFQADYKTQGAYYGSRRAIVVGVPGPGKNPSVHALAHELAHWLDRVAFPPNKMSVSISNKEAYPSTHTFSYLDAFCNTDSIFRSVLKQMNRIENPRSKYFKDLLTPSEVFARLFEQLISISLCRHGVKPVSTLSAAFYCEQQSYWDMDVWESGLYEKTYCQIIARLEMARLWSKTHLEYCSDLLYPVVFPWLLGR